MIPRSWLFAPGDAPAKMQKAAACGTDAVIVDLEDSVAESAKPQARTLASAFVAGAADGPATIWVRVNPLGTGWTADDLAAAVRPGLAGIILPKCEGAGQVLDVASQLERLEAERGLDPGSVAIVPIVTETARSLFALGDYLQAGPRLAGLTWGAEDLSAAIGALSARDEEGRLTDPYLLARSLCLFAAAAAEAAAIETVYPAYRDLEGLAAYARRGRRDGFLGMMAIHPAQVAVINEAFTPTAAEVERARGIIELFDANPGAGTLGLAGQMLDRPHLRQAQLVLARADAAQKNEW